MGVAEPGVVFKSASVLLPAQGFCETEGSSSVITRGPIREESERSLQRDGRTTRSAAFAESDRVDDMMKRGNTPA
jgi:hypothetical protein